MLDERDLQAIKSIMDASIESAITASEERMKGAIESAITASEERTKGAIGTAITASENRMKQYVQESITKSESNLLDEIDRYQKINGKKFNKIQKDIDELKAMHRIEKNDQEVVQILSTRVDRLEDRVEVLENIKPA